LLRLHTAWILKIIAKGMTSCIVAKEVLFLEMKHAGENYERSGLVA
jgi:hypothetical protein